MRPRFCKFAQDALKEEQGGFGTPCLAIQGCGVCPSYGTPCLAIQGFGVCPSYA